MPWLAGGTDQRHHASATTGVLKCDAARQRLDSSVPGAGGKYPPSSEIDGQGCLSVAVARAERS